MQYFNIQLASQLSGVASATIRAWEKRYKAVIPERGDNKHRLYSETDIEKLALLYKLTELGQSIGKIAPLSFEELKDVYLRLMHRPYEERHAVVTSSENIDTEKMLSGFFLALSAYKLDIISHELEKACKILSPKDLCLKILIPLFQEIGHKILRQELSIAQEHTLSALVKFYIGQMIGKNYQKALQKNKLILITTPEGEWHEVGILASALLCVHYGVRFVYLGANLPAESLAEAANALKPHVILMGTTRFELTSQFDLNDYLSVIKNSLEVNAEIWLGGNLNAFHRTELEKKKIHFFSSLEKLDQVLSEF